MVATKYSMDEIRKHDTEKDAWMVIDGYVHDITAFLVEHPGGKDILLDHLGKDASSIFVSEAEHKHSLAAYNILSRYPCLLVFTPFTITIHQSINNKHHSSVHCILFIAFYIPLLHARHRANMHANYI